MDIRSSFCFILINCVLIQYLETKSVSLNELIAAESKGNSRNPVTEKASSKFADTEVKPNTFHETITEEESKLKRILKKPTPRKLKGLFKRLSLTNRLATRPKLRKLKESLGIEKISPLDIRKAFEIKSPLRPKKLKLSQKLKHRRKNQARKREINGNEHIKEKYVPLLKSLSMLFDNLLNSDASDSYETKSNIKRHRFISNEGRQSFNDYSNELKPSIAKSRTHKKATTPAPTISTKVPSNTESLTNNKNHDYSSNRPNKSVPILLPRNTFSFRRDNNGSSKRSGTTHHGDFKRNITRDHRNNEYNTRSGRKESSEESNENYSYSPTRDVASRNGLSRTNRNRYNTKNSKEGKAIHDSTSKDENTNDRFRKIQLETRGNKTESESFLREPVRRLRGYVHEEKGTNNERIVSEPSGLLQPQELHEESILSATDNSTSHKRIVDKNGPLTTENEKIRTGNETVILIERYSRNGNNSNSFGKKVPVVLIFDGYSVTRDKNGQNKVSGKTIHIQP